MGVVGRRRGAVQHDNGEMAEEGVRGVVCDELLGRERNVVGDSNHDGWAADGGREDEGSTAADHSRLRARSLDGMCQAMESIFGPENGECEKQ